MEIKSDAEKLRRYKILLKHFGNNAIKKNYLEQEYKGNKYYIEVKHQFKGEGTRWFHSGKWQFEIVHTTTDGHRNIAPFVLFTSFKDCVLNAMLVEDKLRDNIDQKEKIKL